MGYTKVVKVSDRKIRMLHQLDSDGKPYAEDVTIEVAESVDPSRLSYLGAKDGQIGVFSWGFSPAGGLDDGLQFPEE